MVPKRIPVGQHDCVCFLGDILSGKTLCLSLLVNGGVLRAHISLLKNQVVGNELRNQTFLLTC